MRAGVIEQVLTNLLDTIWTRKLPPNLTLPGHPASVSGLEAFVQPPRCGV